jgi:hypothetical protein
MWHVRWSAEIKIYLQPKERDNLGILERVGDKYKNVWRIKRIGGCGLDLFSPG